MDVQLSCNMVLEGPWGTEGESASGNDETGAFWESRQLVSSACPLLAVEMRVRVVLLPCRGFRVKPLAW